MRIGILGGTFDPPHLGHVIVAQDALESLGLDEVRFLVAADPPHRSHGPWADPPSRVEMVEAAVGGHPRFRVSRIEVDRGGPSYTVETLRYLESTEPEQEWFLLIGSDQLARFHEWQEPEEVASRARLVVLTRGDPEEPPSVQDVEVAFWSVPVTRIDLSSTLIRERVREGRSIRYLVHEDVARIIETKGLYRAENGAVALREVGDSC